MWAVVRRYSGSCPPRGGQHRGRGGGAGAAALRPVHGPAVHRPRAVPLLGPLLLRGHTAVLEGDEAASGVLRTVAEAWSSAACSAAGQPGSPSSPWSTPWWPAWCWRGHPGPVRRGAPGGLHAGAGARADQHLDLPPLERPPPLLPAREPPGPRGDPGAWTERANRLVLSKCVGAPRSPCSWSRRPASSRRPRRAAPSPTALRGPDRGRGPVGGGGLRRPVPPPEDKGPDLQGARRGGGVVLLEPGGGRRRRRPRAAPRGRLQERPLAQGGPERGAGGEDARVRREGARRRRRQRRRRRFAEGFPGGRGPEAGGAGGEPGAEGAWPPTGWPGASPSGPRAPSSASGCGAGSAGTAPRVLFDGDGWEDLGDSSQWDPELYRGAGSEPARRPGGKPPASGEGRWRVAVDAWAEVPGAGGGAGRRRHARIRLR